MSNTFTSTSFERDREIAQLVICLLARSFALATTRGSMERDTRINLVLGMPFSGRADGLFGLVSGLAFDQARGQLLVADMLNHSVQAFSSADGSLIFRFGARGEDHGSFDRPAGIAVDHERDRFVVLDRGNQRLELFSSDTHSHLLSIAVPMQCTSSSVLAIDHRLERIVVQCGTPRMLALSSIDGSLLLELGKSIEPPQSVALPYGLAIDEHRGRIVAIEPNTHRVQVMSSIDGSLLFEFGDEGDEPGQFNKPRGLCVDGQGRIIVADTNNCRLQAFTPHGRFIDMFSCSILKPTSIAFDEHRGLIAFSAGHQVFVIEANQWLGDTFTWRPDRHRYAPDNIKQAVAAMTIIRSIPLVVTHQLPNEILFEIFAYL